MRSRVVLVVVAILAVVFTLRLSIRKSPSPTKLSTKFADKVDTLAPKKERENTPSARNGVLPVAQDATWRSHIAIRAFKPNEAAFAAFADWTERYAAAATAPEKQALEAEGIALANRRQTAMADTIISDPKRALELAAPNSLRESLPTSVRDLLEVPVNSRGDLEVMGLLGNGGDAVPPVVRFANVDGMRAQVFTFDAGLRFVTRHGVPLNGYAVPTAAATTPPANPLVPATTIMVLSSDPAKVLEEADVSKFKAALNSEPICSVSSQPANTFVQLAGEIHGFCGHVHAEDWINTRTAASALDTPGGDVPVSESPYTEGRKRMLLLMPVWSDYMTPAMATNAAVTHFLNFSNYMYEMSYGKLVLAGLGQGSDITPPLLLPGLVADYDNTGLGKLYTTSKDVAQTNYGYDISKYDFPYICTRDYTHPVANYCGLAFVGGVGFHLVCNDAATSCHEYGHNLGLNHAHFWDTSSKSTLGAGVNDEYGDHNDPMGGGASPNSYNSRYKNYLNWIPTNDIVDLNASGSGRYRLYCFDLDNSTNGVRGLKFRYSPTTNYWIDFRQRKTQKGLQNGVQLLWTGNGNEGSYLLDIRVNGTRDDNSIVIGRTFSDTNLNFYVTPIGKGNTYPESMDVVINIGPFPANRPPVATISANVSGSVATFGANASDPDGDALAYYWDFGDGDYSVDNSPSTTHSYTANGEYTAQCTVSDMKGGAARHSVIVRIGSPTTFRISGHVVDSKNRPMSDVRVSSGTGKFAFTDNDGSYTLSGLAAGTYSLDAIEPVAGGFTFIHPYFLNPITLGPNYSTADFVGFPGNFDVYTPLSPKLAAWKYIDNGSDQGTGWTNVTFNDVGWSNGPAILGFGETYVTTTLGYGPVSTNKYTTYYFRREFTVTNTTAYTNLLLESMRDDGIIVYLNGAEVFRNNMPGGAVNYKTFASSVVEAGNTYLPTNLPSSLLVTGVNEFAAEVHQADLTSSDIIFDAALSGLSSTNATGVNICYISDPADNASFLLSNNVTIAASVFTGSSVSQVNFYADGASIGSDDTSPYSLVLTNPLAGTHTLSAVAVIGGSQVTSPPVRITVSAPLPPPPPPVSLTLLQTGSVWRYLSQASAAPGTWATPGFNDSTWPSGPAPLGFGDPEATTIPGGTPIRYSTIYFRSYFVAADPPSVTNLSCLLRRDDGAVVYINGVEVLRDNIAPGAVTYGTLATNAADDGQTYFAFALNPSALTFGTNVVAIEVHQSATNSSDMTLDFGLYGVASTNRPRGIWITAPTEGANVALPGTLTINAEAVVGGSLGIVKVEFYSDGSKIGEDATYPFGFGWADPPSGAHALQAVATDTAGGSVTSSVVNVSVAVPPVSTALVSFGDNWKYLDNGSDQGTAWKARFFDDRSWMAGAAKLGYGGDGEVTTVSYGTNASSKYITTYFRKSITVANPAAYSRLQLRLVRDDGAVVYFNGNEVYRNNMLAGPISFNSLAATTIDGMAETAVLEIPLAATNLISGSNSIAVEIHQVAATSSDIGFDLALLGLTDTNVTQGIYLTSPPNQSHFKTPANIALSAFAASDSPVTNVEYFADGSKIGQASANPYNATWINAPAGVHSLLAIATDASNAHATSAPVTVVIGQPPPPIFPVFQTYITPGSSWRYWDSVASVESGWQSRSFDDTGWSNAPARFGWGLDGEATRLTVTNITTHYFRHWFTVTTPGTIEKLLFELVRDDGAVVYLNGTEVYRSNMPNGPISASTSASATVNTPDETSWFETALATSGSGLLSGSNLVAVELHQAGSSSSDASFDFALYGDGTTESRIYIGSPANNSSVPTTFPLTIEAAVLDGGASPYSSVSNVQFFIDGTNAGQVATFPFRLTLSNPALGAHLLSARLNDNSGTTLDSAPVNINVTRELVSTTFIPAGSVWKYLDNGSDQGTNWSQLSFNDSAWQSGAARLGYGGDGEVTTVSYGPNASAKYITTYFRRSFVAPGGLTYTNLNFRLLRDDGAVVWLNGHELYRSNMPPAGPILSSTPATTAVGGTDEQTFFPTTIATNLPSGTNVLAVEIHQSGGTSSDLGFDLEMIASGYVQTAIPPLLSIMRDDGMVELSWADNGLSWSIYASGDVTMPANSWSRVSAPRVLVSGRYTATITPSGTQRFFRLNRP